MRALYLDSSGMNLRRDYPEPRTPPGESLVRVTTAGICGTDLELARGYMGYSGVPGHEFVGIVERTDSRHLAGQRVVGEINASCDTCDFCAQNLGRHCPHRTVLGILGRDGAFADYLTLPDRNLIPIPEALPDEMAVFIEPLAAAYEIFEQTRIGPNEKILILGDGRLGALLALTLKAEAYSSLVGGHHQAKLQFLDRLGLKVELEQNLKPGFDLVIDSTGRPSGFTRAIELVRPRGRIILKTTAAAGTPLNLASLVINEITVIGSRCGRFQPALAAVEAPRLDPRPLVSAQFPLDDALSAFDAAANRSNFKCLLRMS
jgi:threonine dehydrogenase-like Zn-dependent dehydrogenase